ncbi:Polysaccharide pyruvyl transferase family protein WcaK [Microbacterium sp. cf046]|uniref:polysaccharide pyruvyl transferase family protein n=1 Tax=Microbacterium sp. cf046 TaxID=1761803 RepID=UPI0008EE6C2D|nr:polysaccharide pyruvyl transferase family protein [Microbacterium sp. cf046]SFR88398.1 Polysaccharide pyruvyl transferase family protein WcaK [Microbacterium sp. cf046]
MRPPRWLLAPLQSERLIRAVDRLALRTRAGGGDTHVLIAPPGGGNIGDQALVEAFVEATAGPVLVVVRRSGDIDIPRRLTGRMRLLPLPALVYGSAIGHWRDARKLDRALRTTASVSIVGADIVDGAYVLRASVNRAGLAERLARLGWSPRILGFSWNAHPHPAAAAAMRRASAAGVRMLLRDPLSAARARDDGMTVTETADLVFLATTREDAAVAEVAPGLSAETRLAVVNASGLVGADDGQVRDYARIIAELRADGMRVVIVPHVSRPGADDLPLCRRIAAEFAEDASVSVVERLLAPAQIRALAARASIVVTGRMHLAVMALLAGTPPITVATQGKVEGLMRLFDSRELCVQPGDGFAERVEPVLRGILDDPLAARARLLERLPAVIALATANVDGLGAVREEVLVQ